MITFPLTHHAYKERVGRFLETGAPAPDGVTIKGRWFTASHSKGFMLVEADDVKPLFSVRVGMDGPSWTSRSNR